MLLFFKSLGDYIITHEPKTPKFWKFGWLRKFSGKTWENVGCAAPNIKLPLFDVFNT